MTSHETQSPESSSLELLAQMVASATGISITRMQSRQRGEKLYEARKMFSELAYTFDYSKSEIARFLKKDHTTIGYHLRGRE